MLREEVIALNVSIRKVERKVNIRKVEKLNHLSFHIMKLVKKSKLNLR